MTAPLLQVDGLTVRYPHPQGGLGRWVLPVLDVSFDLQAGDVFCLVGESGSGKTTVARAVMGLAPVHAGSIRLAGRLRAEAPRGTLQMVFQDPAGSLNPRRPAWWLVTEPAALVTAMTREARRALASELLQAVGLHDAHIDRLPHQLSGGQRQRLAIARALSTPSKLLVLDEPTSALDVTVQAQVLDLLLELQSARGLSYLLITHNLSVVRHLGTRVAIMQGGRVVERGNVPDVLDAPRHPFTRRLLQAIPTIASAAFLDNPAVPNEAS